MTVHARIYRNSGGTTPVDYSTPVADLTSGTSYTTAPVAAPSDTTWGLRFYDDATSVGEQNTVATARVVVDPSGADVTAVPPPPVSVSATALAAGACRVRWNLTVPPGRPAPTGFRVYVVPDGTSPSSLGSPAATLPWFADRDRYSTGPSEGVSGADPSGLADGSVYQVYVRSYNAVGEEQNANASNVVGRASAPSPVVPVSGAAVP